MPMSNLGPSRYASVYASPHGPGDARPTAMQILDDEGFLKTPNKLIGKVIVVTGGTSGLGLETAKALYMTGASIIITGRRESAQGHEIVASIKGAISEHSPTTGTAKENRVASRKQILEYVQMDQSDLASVQSASSKILALCEGNIDVLICNAGIMAPQKLERTLQGHELQFGVNYLAHFLLIRHLIPALLANASISSPTRVIVLSSCAHRGSPLNPDEGYDFYKTQYEPMLAYARSKTADIYLANEIERRFGSKHLHGLSVHPGVIMETGLPRHISDDGQKLGDDFNTKSPQFWSYAKNSAQGAASTIWAALAKELEGRGGLYLEDCDVSRPVRADLTEDEWYMPGREKWCYDEIMGRKLWTDSETMTAIWI